jgi:hypothetical protein
MGRRILLPAVLALTVPLIICGCGSGGEGSAGVSAPGNLSRADRAGSDPIEDCMWHGENGSK